MAIIPKQIGWSQESNLIWEVLRQLDQLTKVTSTSGGGGGGTNPTSTYIPYNNAGTFADSYLVNDTANSVLKAIYSSNTEGLELTFTSGISKLGYFNTSSNTDTYLRIEPSLLATIYGGVQDGLIFDYITRIFKFGGVSTYIQSNDIGYTIDTVLNSTIWGLSLDGTNAIFKLGDFGNQGFNNITIESNGTTERVTLQSNNEIYLDDNGTGVMISGTSGGASGNFLVINVNGTQYKIALDTP